MKLWKHFGIIILAMIIGLSLAACNNPAGGGNGGNAPPTSGRLTITGLEDYNGMYVIASGGIGMGGGEFVALEDIAMGGEFVALEDIAMGMVGGKISNGSVTLRIWEVVIEDEKTPELKSYSGSNQGCYFSISIINKAKLEPSEYAGSESFIAYGHVYPVNFSNGVGSGSVLISTVDLGDGIKGDLRVNLYLDEDRSDIRLDCNFPYYWETENSYDYYQDFEVIVNGQTITFDPFADVIVWSGQMAFSVDEFLFTVGETYNIQIKYTAHPERPIKVWIMEDWDDRYEPPANADTLTSFDTGVKTVLAEER